MSSDSTSTIASAAPQAGPWLPRRCRAPYAGRRRRPMPPPGRSRARRIDRPARRHRAAPRSRPRTLRDAGTPPRRTRPASARRPPRRAPTADAAPRCRRRCRARWRHRPRRDRRRRRTTDRVGVTRPRARWVATNVHPAPPRDAWTASTVARRSRTFAPTEKLRTCPRSMSRSSGHTVNALTPAEIAARSAATDSRLAIATHGVAAGTWPANRGSAITRSGSSCVAASVSCRSSSAVATTRTAPLRSRKCSTSSSTSGASIARTTRARPFHPCPFVHRTGMRDARRITLRGSSGGGRCERVAPARRTLPRRTASLLIPEAAHLAFLSGDVGCAIRHAGPAAATRCGPGRSPGPQIGTVAPRRSARLDDSLHRVDLARCRRRTERSASAICDAPVRGRLLRRHRDRRRPLAPAGTDTQYVPCVTRLRDVLAAARVARSTKPLPGAGPIRKNVSALPASFCTLHEEVLRPAARHGGRPGLVRAGRVVDAVAGVAARPRASRSSRSGR